MIFSSSIFLFGFLPIVLGISFLLKRNIKLWNLFLFFASILFYAWGEPKFVVMLLLSIFINWGSAFFLNTRFKNAVLISSVIFNIGILYFCKYFAWNVNILNDVFHTSFPSVEIALPIGISFYTFQGLSYIIDVWNGKVKVQKSLINLGLYISLFPQLIAGPIVRYIDVEKQISYREMKAEDVSAGITRFMIGFSKKVLLADGFAVIVDKAFFLLENNMLGSGFAWLGAIAYTLQIFYDFSGYSDMAIGLGKMLGFHFNENFNYPYSASSVTDFWRRWHISLSSWFRDYVYIPLGGNRKGKKRMYFNLAMVWLLTGIWHGANATFLLWGVVYGIIIITEKALDIPNKIAENRNVFLKGTYRVFTCLVVILLWVVFRAESVEQAVQYISTMLCGTWQRDYNEIFLLYLSEYKWELIVGSIISLPIVPRIKKSNENVVNIWLSILAYVFFIVSISYVIKGTYSPFIYFNF